MTRPLCLTVALFVSCGVAVPPANADKSSVGPLPEGAFSFIVLPDTQGYVTKKTERVFSAEIDWILDQRESQNIHFVSHVGDIINNYDADAEWAVARRQMMKLRGTLPFAFSVGNHDMRGSGESKKFQDTFPAREFESFDWYGGQIKNNANSYQVFSAGGNDFIWLHVECNAPDDVLDWVNDVMAEHASRRAIITTHMYLGPRDRPRKPRDYFDAPKGRMNWKKTHGEQGNSPQQMWEKCFSKHQNLFLICCGDQSRTQAFYQASTGKHGNTVHECLSDYRGGNLRIYRIIPAENVVQVITYSPAEKKLCRKSKFAPKRSAHQFEFAYDLSVAAE